MIKAIIFDLDGVLIDSNYIHYETFIKAVQHINKDIYYSYDEHNTLFNSMTTKNKVKILIQQGFLKNEDIDIIYEKKQELTHQAFHTLQPNIQLISLFQQLVKNKYSLFCCSNSNTVNMKLILTKLGIIDYFQMILGNNDVIHPKPSPEIYTTIMSLANIDPNETLILEDSPIGLQAAYSSKAHVLEIKNINDVSYKNISNTIYQMEQMEV